jgi:hypothetical protein
MTRILVALSLGLFFALAPRTAGEPAKAAAKLADVAWLAGPWRGGAADKAAFEEHWAEPAGSAMVGMFRLLQGGKPVLYELLLLEEAADGVWLRLRHYGPQMADRDKEPIRLKLAEVSDRKAVFENPDHDKPKRITYEREPPDVLTATVETVRDGKPAQFRLRMERAKAK